MGIFSGLLWVGGNCYPQHKEGRKDFYNFITSSQVNRKRAALCLSLHLQFLCHFLMSPSSLILNTLFYCILCQAWRLFQVFSPETGLRYIFFFWIVSHPFLKVNLVSMRTSLIYRLVFGWYTAEKIFQNLLDGKQEFRRHGLLTSFMPQQASILTWARDPQSYRRPWDFQPQILKLDFKMEVIEKCRNQEMSEGQKSGQYQGAVIL